MSASREDPVCYAPEACENKGLSLRKKIKHKRGRRFWPLHCWRVLHLSAHAVLTDLLLQQARELSEFQHPQASHTAFSLFCAPCFESKKGLIKHQLICFESLTQAAQNLLLALEMAQRPRQGACPEPLPTKLCPEAGCYCTSNSLKSGGREKAQSLAICTKASGYEGHSLRGKTHLSPPHRRFQSQRRRVSPCTGLSTDSSQQPAACRHTFCFTFTSSLQMLSAAGSLLCQACKGEPKFCFVYSLWQACSFHLPSIRKWKAAVLPLPTPQ